MRINIVFWNWRFLSLILSLAMRMEDATEKLLIGDVVDRSIKGLVSGSRLPRMIGGQPTILVF